MRSTRPRPVPFRPQQQRTQASSRARLASPAATSPPSSVLTRRSYKERKDWKEAACLTSLDSSTRLRPTSTSSWGTNEKAGWFGIQKPQGERGRVGSPRHPYLPLSLSLARVACVLLGWLAGWLVRRLPSPPETFSLSSPFGLVVALSYASSEESYRPVSFPYGRLIASFKRRGGAWERASERELGRGGSCGKLLEGRGEEEEECEVCVPCLALLHLVGWFWLASRSLQAKPTDKSRSWLLGAPLRWDSVPRARFLVPLRRFDEVCRHGGSRRHALRRACGGWSRAHGSGGSRRRRGGGAREGEPASSWPWVLGFAVLVCVGGALLLHFLAES